MRAVFNGSCTARRIAFANANYSEKANTYDSRHGNDAKWPERSGFIA